MYAGRTTSMICGSQFAL